MSNNYRKAPRPHRPCYCFDFPTVEDSKKFFNFANSLKDTHLVQHPYSSDGRGKRLDKQVLVTGSGSQLFDLNLKKQLMDKAHELGGNMVPA